MSEPQEAKVPFVVRRRPYRVQFPPTAVKPTRRSERLKKVEFSARKFVREYRCYEMARAADVYALFNRMNYPKLALGLRDIINAAIAASSESRVWIALGKLLEDNDLCFADYEDMILLLLWFRIIMHRFSSAHPGPFTISESKGWDDWFEESGGEPSNTLDLLGVDPSMTVFKRVPLGVPADVAICVADQWPMVSAFECTIKPTGLLLFVTTAHFGAFPPGVKYDIPASYITNTFEELHLRWWLITVAAEDAPSKDKDASSKITVSP